MSQRAFYIGGLFLTIATVMVTFIQEGQVVAIYFMSIFAGLGVGAALLLPWSMLPDVMSLDELTVCTCVARRVDHLSRAAPHNSSLGDALSMANDVRASSTASLCSLRRLDSGTNRTASVVRLDARQLTPHALPGSRVHGIVSVWHSRRLCLALRASSSQTSCRIEAYLLTTNHRR